MGWDILSWGLPVVLALLLVSAGIEDARIREIANWKNAAIALMAKPPSMAQLQSPYRPTAEEH